MISPAADAEPVEILGWDWCKTLNPSSRLPTVAELAETWSSEGCLNAEQTKERITAIKVSLKKETA